MLGDQKMSRRTKKQLTPEELAQRQEFKKKRSRRRWKAFRGSLLRLLLLALVLYVLFFHLVGLMIMPTGDMFPRIDAGDLVLYYRLEQTPKAQDIVVLEKAVHDDLSAVRPDEEPEEGAETAEVPWLWQVLPDWGRKAAVRLGFRDPTARPARRPVKAPRTRGATPSNCRRR